MGWGRWWIGPWRGRTKRRGRVRHRTGPATAGLVGLALAAVPGALVGQELPAPDIGLVGGSFSYDLGVRGDDTSPFVGLRVRLPLSRWILVEPALAFTRLTADSVDAGADPDLSLLVMEFQAQAQVAVDRLRPYLGVGAGGVLDLRDRRGPDDFLMSTYSGSLGVAVDLGASWAVRSEVRYRAMDDRRHSALELGVALSTTF